ncbi:ATV_HP_G0140830.mRNA.1.CDS.1 [Saccharomyces cerevisiae]|nr:ATV_HP_G0140830.mRNA.1.CDS.1 [Saccharomyces cerevisiae]CAI6905570.1 ATV_HP_G0140830.mRNA.1.CDS.1 [Saccharomyces cerevisiae]
MLCTADTPEGEACGLVKNLALMTHITTDDEEEPIKKLCYVLGVEDITLIDSASLHLNYGVYLNGTLIGSIGFPTKFVTQFRHLRRTR